jgi:hypothetical protein
MEGGTHTEDTGETEDTEVFVIFASCVRFLLSHRGFGAAIQVLTEFRLMSE